MRRALWLLAALVVVLLGVGIYLAVVRPRVPIEVPVGKGCRAQTEQGTVRLFPEQMANAATIAAVGLVRGVPQRGVVVALATAMQESSLYNLDHGHLDSLGLFQQRPSMGWGTTEQVQDPRYAANTFYDHLLQVDGWEGMRVTDAAQAVQRSGAPEAYEQWADFAQILGDAFGGEHEAAVSCAQVESPSQRGSAAAQAVVAGLRADWGPLASTVATGSGTAADSLSIAVPDTRGGWQFAHWLVAQANGLDVSQVRFGDRQWTIESGEWTRVDTPDTGSVVIADVYPV